MPMVSQSVRVVLLFLLTCSLFLAAPADAKKVEGELVMEDGRTHRVVIKVSGLQSGHGYGKMQGGIKYRVIGGDKGFQRLRPNKECDTEDCISGVTEFNFSVYVPYQGELFIRMVLAPDVVNGKLHDSRKIFMRLVVDGELRWFSKYKTASGNGFASLRYKHVLVKANGQTHIVSDTDYGAARPAFNEFFEECPALQKKVETEKLRPRRSEDLETIVRFYNASCVASSVAK